MGTPGEYAVAPTGVALRCADRKLGEAVHHYTYVNADGDPIVHVDYYHAPDDAHSISGDGLIRKYWTYDPGRGVWDGGRGVPKPTILYRLNDIESSGSALIVVVPTERDVEYLRTLLVECDLGEEAIVPTTWLGPDGRAAHSEVAPLADKPVMLLIPSGSKPAMAEFAATCLRSGIKVAAATIEHAITDIPSLAQLWAILRSLGRPMAMSPPQPKAQRAASSVGVVSVGALPLIERWREWGFDTNGQNKPWMNTANVKKYLAHHAGCYGDVWLDQYRKQIRHGEPLGENREWCDADDAVLQITLQTEAGLHIIGKNAVHDAIVAHAHEHARHPYREGRAAATWDGVERIHEALRLGWGCPDDEYHRELSKGFFLQQALRVMYPGCKADMMVMFEGPTNIGKTSAIGIVFGRDNVASPTAKFGTQKFYEEIQGKAVVEIADLHSFKGAALEAIKAGVSRTIDRFRPAYGRYAEDFPRQSVFVGTTESSDWNEDPALTARRFPAAECTKIDFEWLRLNAEQLLAEAWQKALALDYNIAMAGSYWNLPSEVATEKQKERVKSDMLDEMVSGYLLPRSKVSALDVAREALNVTDVTRLDVNFQARVVQALRKAGWISKRNNTGRWWEPGPYANRPSKVTF